MNEIEEMGLRSMRSFPGRKEGEVEDGMEGKVDGIRKCSQGDSGKEMRNMMRTKLV